MVGGKCSSAAKVPLGHRAANAAPAPTASSALRLIMTLNLRAPSNAQQFRSHVGHLRVGGFGLHEAEHVGQDLVGMASILAHAGHRQVRELPAITIADLGRRHPVASPYAA